MTKIPRGESHEPLQPLHDDGRGAGGPLSSEDKPASKGVQQAAQTEKPKQQQGGFVDRLKGL